jgi:hypothetical protein
MPLPLFSMVYEVEQRDQVQNLGARQIEDQVTFLGGNEILSGFLHSKIYARINEHHPRPGFASGNY